MAKKFIFRFSALINILYFMIVRFLNTLAFMQVYKPPDEWAQKQVEALSLGESTKPEAPRPRFNKVPKIGDKSAYSPGLSGDCKL